MAQGYTKTFPSTKTKLLSALGREDIMRKAWWKDYGIFRYEIYELFTERRFIRPETTTHNLRKCVLGTLPS
jgi:hypothetical protein